MTELNLERMKNSPIFKLDFYKTVHHQQYPKGTEVVYSTFIPRSNNYMPFADKAVFFGLQGFIKSYLMDGMDKWFFSQPREEVLYEYEFFMTKTLGMSEFAVDHIAALHDLGYMPLLIKALPEGTRVPMRVAMFTIENTHPDFYWLTNYVESVMSAIIWKTVVSATISYKYRSEFDKYIEKTGLDAFGVNFQGHDFSYRGMGGDEAAQLSGAGHLVNFLGTDTIPAIIYLQNYYNANIETELVGTSIPATEHSVMCAGGADNEYQTIERLLEEVYPSGFLSIVSDTWDFFGALENIYKPLRDKIMARDGKIVIRPDSGDPVKIVCGDPDAPIGTPEFKGAWEILWDIFGGTITEQGYKLLDSHIGLIYGDAITVERQEQILAKLTAKGFVPSVVLGIGSYTYNMNSRDSLGIAIKATSVTINGVQQAIFKDPKTDDGIKKSPYGRVGVFERFDGELTMYDESHDKNATEDFLKPVFEDGRLLVNDSITEIRNRLR